jgi:hypothetical protein
MTDYSELIRKARAVPGPTMLTTYPARTTPDPLSNALADALEAQAQEISQYKVDVNEALLDCKRLHARIAELEAALTDCADALEEWVDDLHARGSVPYERDLAAVDAARAALKGEK